MLTENNRKALRRRLLERVKIDESGLKCWRWQLSVSSHGYSNWQIVLLKTRMAHRISYIIFRGEIPDGMQIDHLCRVRSCVNPYHLELVTPAENVQRGHGNASRTHCPQGHEYNEKNTHIDKTNRRHCLVCSGQRTVVYRNRPDKREKYNAYMRQYRQDNLEKMRAYDRARRPPGSQVGSQ